MFSSDRDVGMYFKRFGLKPMRIRLKVGWSRVIFGIDDIAAMLAYFLNPANQASILSWWAKQMI